MLGCTEHVMTVRLPYLADTTGAGPNGLPSLDLEPELSFAQLGLSDTLLGDGQYGQTLMVSFCRVEGCTMVIGLLLSAHKRTFCLLSFETCCVQLEQDSACLPLSLRRSAEVSKNSAQCKWSQKHVMLCMPVPDILLACVMRVC